MSRLWRIACVALFSASVTAAAQTATKLEVRLAESKPAPGLTEAMVSSSGQKIYLHADVLVTSGDVARARIVEGAGGYGYSIAVQFNQAGSEKMAKATGDHLDRPVAILIDGEVVAAPVLRRPINATLTIAGNFEIDQVEAIAAGLNAR